MQTKLDIYAFITLLALHILHIWCSRNIFALISPVVCGRVRALFTLVAFVCV